MVMAGILLGCMNSSHREWNGHGARNGALASLWMILTRLEAEHTGNKGRQRLYVPNELVLRLGYICGGRGARLSGHPQAPTSD